MSDTYQDLFGEGIFTGKGLYDVDAFMAALEDSVPENALLSHDLFEGLHARVALVSDVELVDEYPSSVLAHARRQHRWIRGDWQILFWLFPFVPSRHGLTRNTLPLIGRWKILDNLRRSLVAPALLALLVAGWTVLPGRRWFWTSAVAGRSWPRSSCRWSRGCWSDPAGRSRSRSSGAICAKTRRPRSAQVALGVTFLAIQRVGNGARDRPDARAARRHAAAPARVGDGGRAAAERSRGLTAAKAPGASRWR